MSTTSTSFRVSRAFRWHNVLWKPGNSRPVDFAGHDLDVLVAGAEMAFGIGINTGEPVNLVVNEAAFRISRPQRQAEHALVVGRVRAKSGPMQSGKQQT
jgi:hypothetical protein